MTFHDNIGYETGRYQVIRSSRGTRVDGHYVPSDTVDSDAGVNSITDELTILSHGLSTGFGPVWATTTDTLPGGILPDVPYWLIASDDDHLQLAVSKADALDGQPVELLDDGIGTLHLATFFYVSMDIQDDDGRSLSDMPEGQSTIDKMICWTSTELFTRHPDYDPDLVVIDGEHYRVYRVSKAQVLSGHYRIYIERLAVP